ncbi:MAG: hypothetical protein NTW32_13865 [Chloroflexi bacterium]|nr:hypothetical protein [Chloroflexota bacterium]
MILCLADRIGQGTSAGSSGTPKTTLVIKVQADSQVDYKYDDVIHYTVSVKNNGSLDLANILLSSNPGSHLLDLPAAFDLVAGASSAPFVLSHPINQPELDAGFLAMKLTAAVTNPADGSTISSVSKPVRTTIKQRPISVYFDNPPSSMGGIGNSLYFSAIVKNSGKTNLLNLLASPNVWTWQDQSKQTKLAPGDSVYLSWSYQITQDDLDQGSLDVSIGVTGTPEKDPNHTVQDSAMFSLLP